MNGVETIHTEIKSLHSASIPCIPNEVSFTGGLSVRAPANNVYPPVGRQPTDYANNADVYLLVGKQQTTHHS